MPLQSQQPGFIAEAEGDIRAQRNSSDASPEVKPRNESRKWSLSTMFSKRNPTGRSPKPDSDSETFPGRILSPFENDSAAADIKKLAKYSNKIRGTSNIDVAYEEYKKTKEGSSEICKRLLNMSSRRRESLLVSPTITATSAGLEPRPTSSLDVLSLADTRSSISSSSLVDAFHLSTTQDQYAAAVHSWVQCLETLTDNLQKSLRELYDGYENNPTPEGFEVICSDKAVRESTITRMHNENVTKLVSKGLDFFPRYRVRFRSYDQMKKDLNRIHSQLHAEEPEASTERQVITQTISMGGDVILQFANTSLPNCPIYCFRVSSSSLADKSLFFSHMFKPGSKDGSGAPTPYRLLPSPNSPYSPDVKLYTILETELNREQSFEILLNAAHGTDSKLPIKVGFEQFVAIAEVCLRYQFTETLGFAAIIWLQQWAGEVTDDMTDGLLLISYAFGHPDDFTHISRTAILNIVSEDDLQKKQWPQNIKDKIGAVRRAKLDQIFDCCRSFLLEYMSLPIDSCEGPNQAPNSRLVPASTPRCRKGDPKCAASNVGWMMMVFRDLGILPYIIPSEVFDHQPAPPNQSLAQLVDSLRLMASHTNCHNGVVCDFALHFRRAIDDIYACISGLTLYEVSEKQGWAPSDRKLNLPRIFSEYPSGKREVSRHRFNRRGVTAFLLTREATQLELLGSIDNHRDLLALAMVNKSFYSTYRRNKAIFVERLSYIDADKSDAAVTTIGITLPEDNLVSWLGDSSPYTTISSITAGYENTGSTTDQEGAMPTEEPNKTLQMITEDKHLRDEYDQFIGSRARNNGRNSGSRRKLVSQDYYSSE